MTIIGFLLVAGTVIGLYGLFFHREDECFHRNKRGQQQKTEKLKKRLAEEDCYDGNYLKRHSKV